MSYRYRLLCIDVDGTLLDSNKKLPQRNIEAIKKACDSGVKVAIASGRSPWSVHELLEEIGIHGCEICLNGSYVVDKGKEVFKHSMNDYEIEKILNIVIKYNVTAFFTTSEINITNRKCERDVSKSVVNSKNYIVCDNSYLKNELMNHKGLILKVSIREDDGETYQKVRDELESLDLFEVQKSDVAYLDINSKGTNKSTGVKELAQYLDFDLSHVACIGDNENDIDMIKNCGLGIAMANSCDELLKISDKATSSNDECGVAEAIERYILK